MKTSAYRRFRPGQLVVIGLISASSLVPQYGASAFAPAKDAKETRVVKDPFTRGMELFKAGKLEEALAAFKQAETTEPNDAIIQSWIGFIHFKQNRHDDAIKFLTKSIQLNPN